MRTKPPLETWPTLTVKHVRPSRVKSNMVDVQTKEGPILELPKDFLVLIDKAGTLIRVPAEALEQGMVLGKNKA